MSIRIVCSCGFSKLVPDAWAGKSAKCRCGQTLAVPDTVQLKTESADEDDVDPLDFLPKPKHVTNRSAKSVVSPIGATTNKKQRRDSEVPTQTSRTNKGNRESTLFSEYTARQERQSSAARLPLPKPHFRTKEIESGQPADDGLVQAVSKEEFADPAPTRRDPAPLALALIALIILIGVGGYAGWLYFEQQKNKQIADSSSTNQEQGQIDPARQSPKDNNKFPFGIDPTENRLDDSDDTPVTDENDTENGIGAVPPLTEKPATAPNAVAPAASGNLADERPENETATDVDMGVIEDLLKSDASDAISNTVAPPGSATKPPETDLAKGTDEQPGNSGKEISLDGPQPVTALSSLDGLLLSDVSPLSKPDDLPVQQLLTVDQQNGIVDIENEFRQATDGLIKGTTTIAEWKTHAESTSGKLLGLLQPEQTKSLLDSLRTGTAQPVNLDVLVSFYRPEVAIRETPWSLTPGPETRVIDSKVNRISIPSNKVSFIGLTPGTPIVAVAANQNPAQVNQFLITVLNVKNQPHTTSKIYVDRTGLSSILAADDARHIVITRSRNGQTTQEIWSTETGLLVDQLVPQANQPGGGVRPIKATSQFVYLLSRTRLSIWDFQNDDMKQIELAAPESESFFGQVDFSADGKYFACVGKHEFRNPLQQRIVVFEIAVYDLSTRLRAGSIRYAPYDTVTDRGSVRFSPDSQQLAVLLKHGRGFDAQRRLLNIDAGTGKILRTYEIPKYQMRRTSSSIFRRELVWLPDSAGWLIGLSRYVAAATGEIGDLTLPDLKRNPANPSADPQRVIDAYPTTKGKLVLVLDNRQTNGKSVLSTKAVRLPKVVK